MRLRLLQEVFGILKLEPPQPFPDWLAAVTPFFLAQTEDEYSIICPQQIIPTNETVSRDWHCLRVDGDLEFDEVGVVARVSRPLADAGLSIFLVSTHDRDYVFFQENKRSEVVEIYRSLGWIVAENHPE